MRLAIALWVGILLLIVAITVAGTVMENLHATGDMIARIVRQ